MAVPAAVGEEANNRLFVVKGVMGLNAASVGIHGIYVFVPFV